MIGLSVVSWARDLFGPGDWFFTRSGRRQFVRRPNIDEIVLEDIAEPLAKLCRFNGQCCGFYSVAQHCVLVSQLVPPEFALEGLMHDAVEAYLGDVIRPVKAELRRYKRLERIWEPAFAQRFGLLHPLPPAVKRADLYALAWERRDLAPWSDPNLTPEAWKWKADDLDVHIASTVPTIIPLEWREAQEAFTARFHEIEWERRRMAA